HQRQPTSSMSSRYCSTRMRAPCIAAIGKDEAGPGPRRRTAYRPPPPGAPGPAPAPPGAGSRGPIHLAPRRRRRARAGPPRAGAGGVPPAVSEQRGEGGCAWGQVGNEDDDAGDTGDAVRMNRRVAVGDAKVARGDVLNDEGETGGGCALGRERAPGDAPAVGA